MLLAEVRDADRTGAAFREKLLDRFVRLDGSVEVGGDGLVEQEEVDVVEAEAPQAAFEADEGLFVAVVAEPQLRRDEQVGAVDAEARIAAPTSRSLSYEAAVSIKR